MCHEKCFLRLEPRMGRKNSCRSEYLLQQTSRRNNTRSTFIFWFSNIGLVDVLYLSDTINLYLIHYVTSNILVYLSVFLVLTLLT